MLFKIDPTPYQLAVNTLTAQLSSAQAGQRELQEQLKGATATSAQAKSAITQATARVSEVNSKYELAKRRVDQYRELVATGAGTRFDLEQAEATYAELTGQLANVKSAEAQARSGAEQADAAREQVQQKLGAKVDGGEYASVAQIRAQLESAKWISTRRQPDRPATAPS